MEKRIGIRGKYIQVRRKGMDTLTFGGDQGFFDCAEATDEDRRKKTSGCGIIAFADLLLYLGSRNSKFRIEETQRYTGRILQQEEYVCYYNDIYSFLGGIPFKGGVSWLKLFLKFNRLSGREGWNLKAMWGFSGRKLFDRIEKMLAEDIPVILCIPMMLLKKDRKDGLWLYQREKDADGTYIYHQKAFTKAHYVMITGEVYGENTVYYEISSWGKKYYINRNEYDTLIHTHFCGTILGNILYIRQKKRKAHENEEV